VNVTLDLSDLKHGGGDGEQGKGVSPTPLPTPVRDRLGMVSSEGAQGVADNTNVKKESRRRRHWIPRANSWRKVVFLIFDDPSSSLVSLVFSVISALAVMLSCAATVVESEPQYRLQREIQAQPLPAFDMIEIVCVMFFTVEYVVRVLTCSSMPQGYITGDIEDMIRHGFLCGLFSKESWIHLSKTYHFVMKPLNLLDLVAILPWYIEASVSVSAELLAPLRIVRLLRLVRLFKGNTMIPLMLKVVGRAAPLILQVAMVLCLFLVFLAFVLFTCESGSYNEETDTFERKDLFGNPEPSPFDSVFITLWWALVTATTVGYGDITPTTAAGRIVASCGMAINVILFAVPVTIITTIFMEEYKRASTDGYYNDLHRTIVKLEGGRITRLIRQDCRRTFEYLPSERTWLPRGNVFEKIFFIFEDFDGGIIGSAVQTAMNLLIVLSIIALAVETLPAYRYPNYGDNEGDSAPVFGVLELGISIAFTIELLARLGTVWAIQFEDFCRLGYKNVKEEDGVCMRSFKWLKTWTTIVDVLSTAPYYIQSVVALPSLEILRVVRLLRIARVLRLARKFKAVVILSDAIKKSGKPLSSLSVVFGAWVVFAASVCFFCEKGSWNSEAQEYQRDNYGTTEETPFQSISAAFWWMIVTLTTVGFGDMYPTSVAGRITGIMIMLVSVVMLAVPIGIVSVNMDKATEKNRKRRQAQAAVMYGEVEESHIIHGIPSVKFYDEVVRSTGNVEDILVEINYLLDYYSDFMLDTDSVIRRQVKAANMTLVPSAILDAKRRFRRLAALMDGTFDKIVRLQNYHAKIWEMYSSTTRNRKVFTRALRNAISARTCFIFWAQYVKNRKIKRHGAGQSQKSLTMHIASPRRSSTRRGSAREFSSFKMPHDHKQKRHSFVVGSPSGALSPTTPMDSKAGEAKFAAFGPMSSSAMALTNGLASGRDRSMDRSRDRSSCKEGGDAGDPMNDSMSIREMSRLRRGRGHHHNTMQDSDTALKEQDLLSNELAHVRQRNSLGTSKIKHKPAKTFHF